MADNWYSIKLGVPALMLELIYHDQEKRDAALDALIKVQREGFEQDRENPCRHVSIKDDVGQTVAGNICQYVIFAGDLENAVKSQNEHKRIMDVFEAKYGGTTGYVMPGDNR